ncbi:hypothetical protein HYALB_00009410 [Hymenoscyphus albidus]|uniref:DUF7719 domain-containing protein n=1 Tax=Hymenoscyphus albidus TaxID=595503 RepID=A0A9N9LHZ9_9HELO|nr:hypothetical protein HYALB_00009410 [Hymenoscyphus albidus]
MAKKSPPSTTKSPKIPLAQPDRSAPQKANTLIDLARQSGILDAAQKAQDEEPLVGRVGDSILWSLSLTMLHFTLDVLVANQFSDEMEWRSLVVRTAQAFPIILLFFYFLHPHPTPPILLPRLPQKLQKPLHQAFFFVSSVAAGCYLIHSTNTDAYYAVMKRSPPLGVLWIWSVIEMDVVPATVSLLVCGGFLKGGGPAIGLLSRAPSLGSGSGPYRVTCSKIRSLPSHTIYQPDPSTIPINSTIPVILWGNGACAGWGGCFSKFLIEVASHGYFIIANGIPQFKGLFRQTSWTDMMEAMDWVTENCGEGGYRHIDKSKIAVAGQAGGAIQAYTASLDERVKLTCIFNGGLLVPQNVQLFERFHAPVAYFLGGPTDMAFKNGERDYAKLPSRIPAVKLNLPVGHMGTFGRAQGGKFGKAAIAFLEWQMKGDTIAANQFTAPSTSPLTAEGWDIVSKHWEMNERRAGRRSIDVATSMVQ